MIEVTQDILPEDEPIDLATAKLYLKMDSITEDDSLIELMIRAARKACEKYTGLSFGPKIITVTDYQKYKRDLPYGPVQDITSVTDADGVEIDIAQWTLNPLSWYAEYLKGMSISRDYPIDCYSDSYYSRGVTVVYNAGYAVGQCPDEGKLAILKTVAEMYENRENTVVGTIIQQVPESAKYFLNLLRPKTILI